MSSSLINIFFCFLLLSYAKTIFTRDQFQTDPNGSGQKIGSDRPSVYIWNRSGTCPEGIQMDPELDLLFFTSNFGFVWICSGPVPERSRVNRGRSGPVRFGTVPVRSRILKRSLSQWEVQWEG